MVNESQSPTRSTRPSQSFRSPMRDALEAALFAIVAAMFLKTFVVEAYRIPTGSMETTLRVGDMLLVNKFIYNVKTPTSIPFTDVRLPYVTIPGVREPVRGDIIVFEYPGDRDEVHHDEVVNYIKRCVGTPGDTVVVRSKILYVNGQKFFTPPGMQFMQGPMPPERIDPSIFPAGTPFNRDNYGPLRIPKKGDIIALTAQNFRQWDILIRREGHQCDIRGGVVRIDGQVATQYTIQRNYYFMMGDNRDDSADSRFWGFVPQDNIVGQAMVIYWSWDPEIPFSNLFKLIASTRFERLLKLVH
jgi:signal peptidase I